jgi:hypothetical protein
LVPPQDVEIETLFHLLERVHHQTLDIHETIALKTSIFYPEIRELGIPLVKPLAAASVKKETMDRTVSAEVSAEFSPSIDSVRQQMQDQIDQNIEEACPEKEKDVEVVEAISRASSLELDEACLMSDQDVMDKALIAMSFVSEKGYARRIAASNSIIENLKIKKFVEQISGGTYTSVEGTMRSLTMALRKYGYIERVHCTPTNGEISEGVRGYRLTSKAEKRIVALKSFLEDSLISRMNPRWSRSENQIQTQEAEHADPESDDDDLVGEVSDKTGGLTSDDLSRIKSWIDAHEEANNQINEAEHIIGNLESEKSDLMLTSAGIVSTREEQIQKRDELIKRIARLDEKEEEIKKEIEQKNKEIKDWRIFQLPYISEKERIESEITNLTGKRKSS